MVETTDQFDVVVIGGGPGGYAAALYGASAGLKVAVVEKEKVGGTCLHRGCVPAKEFLETASVLRSVKSASTFGISAAITGVDFAVSQSRKQSVVDQLWKGLSGLMKGRGIEVIEGIGKYLGDGKVEVLGSRVISGDSIILATGSAPRTIPGFEVSEYVLTSDEVLSLTTLPKSVAVIGGGAIGCEFASMMSDMGVEVTIIEALPQILTGCDKDVADVVVRSFKKRGIQTFVSSAVEGHQNEGSTTKVMFGGGQSVSVEKIIVSVGRRPLSDGLIGPQSKVQVDQRGFVLVDEYMRTSESGVYAIGDLIATPQLAHVGFAEAILAIKTILGEPVTPVDYGKVPWCIYTHPEVAFVGMTEAQAREAGYEVLVKKDPYGGNSRARIIGETDGVVKVICEKRSDGSAGAILGVHMAGPWVTEQLGQAYLSVNWEATPEEVSQFIQPHPTLSEAFGETVLALTGRGLHVG
ncbi:MAG: dihydrolipoyl dehydrogenase [Acidimicrobiaceae bacterium]|nr:dihydrolipoyl dehydrogenase [Acidimicrobiaceae bacterium]